jgi:hypothetical protein
LFVSVVVPLLSLRSGRCISRLFCTSARFKIGPELVLSISSTHVLNPLRLASCYARASISTWDSCHSIPVLPSNLSLCNISNSRKAFLPMPQHAQQLCSLAHRRSTLMPSSGTKYHCSLDSRVVSHSTTCSSLDTI